MSKIVSRDEFIKKAQSTHHNKYNYTLLPNRITTADRVMIVCSTHGPFEQLWSSHLQGHGCPKCSWDNKKHNTQIRLIERAKKVHNNYYDYSQVRHTDAKVPVIVICPKHGPFKTRMWNHILGPDKCPLCGSGKNRTTEDFIILAKEVHGDRYDYSLSQYVNATTKLTILCNRHGPFEQTPDVHCLTASSGCPSCRASLGERKIYKTLKDMGIENFICEKRFDNLTNINTKRPLFYDFFLPQQNILIEYDGESHFKHVNYSGKLTTEEMEDRLQQTIYLDNLKNKYAEDNNIALIRIPYWESDNIPNILSKALTER